MHSGFIFCRLMQRFRSNNGKVYFFLSMAKNNTHKIQNVENLPLFAKNSGYHVIFSPFSTDSFPHFQHSKLLKTSPFTPVL